MDEEEIFIMNQAVNDVAEAEELYQRPRRRFYIRENAFNLSEIQFRKLFRLDKETTRYVIAIISEHGEHPTRTSAISIEIKVLIALHFYGHGTYQTGVGKTLFTAVSQSTASRAIKEVTNILNQIMGQFVIFPRNLNDLQELKARFYRKYQFPGVIGCVDGTHIALAKPIENEHIYVNRKHYHSLNVQLVCDDNLKILHVCARFPGSCHDAHIWRLSNISPIMERIYREGNETFFLLGDSGYPLRPWLLTPFENALPNTPEERCNNRLTSTRSLIERCNGLLKNRFRCLLKHRVLHYKPDMVAKITNACVVLHNICIDNNVPEPDNEDYNLDIEIEVDVNVEQPVNRVNMDLIAGRQLRNTIAHNYFN